MKSCSKCGRIKPLEGFTKDATSKDGHYSSCRECARIVKRRWDRDNMWRHYDDCPVCGERKKVEAERCRRCDAPRRLRNLRDGYWRWREEHPEEWERVRRQLQGAA